jgi:hypothetical protein
MSSEFILYFGLGFLCASFTALIVMPFIHGHAVKQATQRLESVCIRALEETIEDLRNKIATHRAELAQKDDNINRLKIECAALDVDLVSLKAGLQAVESSERPKRNNIVPMTKHKESKTATESFDDASIVPTNARGLDEDSWTRDRNPSDMSQISTGDEDDTWVRVETGSDPMPQRADAASRMEIVFTQDTKAKVR